MTKDELLHFHKDEVIIMEIDLLKSCEKATGIKNLKGLYKNGKIFIDHTLSDTEKKCILGEEIGHHYTSKGNIIDLRKEESIRQEILARVFGALLVVDKNLIESTSFEKLTLNEIMHKLDITEDFARLYKANIDVLSLKDNVDRLVTMTKLKRLVNETILIREALDTLGIMMKFNNNLISILTPPHMLIAETSIAS